MISNLQYFLAAETRFGPIFLQWPYGLSVSKAILQSYRSVELDTFEECIRIDTLLQPARW